MHLFLCTGCNVDSQEKLVVCTDSYSYEYVKNTVERWKYLQREGSSIEVEIVTIPKDDTAAEVKITEIRTEIMSGDGPDLFIIKVPLSRAVAEDRADTLLFSNPEKVMYSNIFLPLDTYLKEFTSVDIEECNQAVLQAGQTDEGQLLFPILYDYNVCVFSTEESSESFFYPNSWDELIQNEEMLQAIYRNDIYGFLAYSGPYADYKNEELLISKDDIVKQVEQCLSEEKKWENVRGMSVNSMLYDLSGNDSLSYECYPIPNIDGGVTANISAYAGINRNTRVADEAASFLDMFCENIKGGGYSLDGIFIEQDEYLQRMYQLQYGFSKERLTSFLEMNEMVTEARFYSMWDYELWDVYYEQKWKAEQKVRPIEQMADEIYNTMKMQVKE